MQITMFQLLLFTVFGVLAAILAVQDHRCNQLADVIVFPLAIAGIIVNYFDIIVDFDAALGGVIAGFCSVQTLRIYQKYRFGVTGIGLGDAKFLGALGAWLGLSSLPFLVVGGALLMLMFYLRREEKPFGVGLSLSAVGILGWRLIG